MKNIGKLTLLSALVAIFVACSSEPKSVQYYQDPKNATELEAKIKECNKNANSADTDTECANAYKAQYSKSSKKLRDTEISDEEAKKYFKRDK
ncbi:EexN family lipoprotein [Campylobacter insulaenigrae]|uniref:EexN family lipoprotein n=1 Tax=Campylobacter insulaenigrae TaxID=260714 RepID=UPI0021524345|nr:EexN family lipoprotein [Campylobacter insulaenigrae]MCR6580378.1 EexN family lipoprotein [Campylobacter insulaenigrae]